MLDAGALGFVLAVISGTQKMQELLAALLAYAREAESAGRGTAELPAVVQDVLASLKAEIESAGAQIVCGELPVVRGDFLHILRLFQNLMENALKYRSQEPLHVQIDAQQQADHWLVSFRDNGMGIPPAQHDAIFAPLRRLHGQEIPGTGMGLAICKKIVERLGGRIWVESNAGQGAVFYFTLPAI